MLKVWHNVNGKNTYRAVSSVDDAKKLIDLLTFSDLKDPSVTFNAFGLLDHNGDEWSDENGSDIMEVMEEDNA